MYINKRLKLVDGVEHATTPILTIAKRRVVFFGIRGNLLSNFTESRVLTR